MRKLSEAEAISSVADEIRMASQERKSEFEWQRSHHGFATKHDLKEMVDKIMAMTAQQLEDALDKMTTQAGKIAKEQSDRFDALTQAIKDLNDQIAAGGGVTPGVEAKQAALQTALDSMDAAIPDAPVV